LDILTGTLTHGTLQINPNGQEVDVHGSLTATFLLEATNASINVDFTGQNSYLVLAAPNSDPQFVGPIIATGEFEEFSPGWDLADIAIQIDPMKGTISGSGNIQIPFFGGGLGAQLSFITKPTLELSSIHVEADFPGDGIPIVPEVLNLDAIHAG